MKYLTGLFTLILPLLVISQQQIAVLDPGIKKFSRFYESLSFINKTAGTNDFFIALAEEDNVHFYLFDKNWKIISQYKENREWVSDQGIYQDYKRFMPKSNIFFSSEFQPVGSINTGDKQFTIAFLRNHKLYFQKVDFISGKSTNLDLWEPPNKARILHSFTFNNKLFWITYNKKEDDLISLNRYDAGGKTETKTISIRQLRSVDNIFRPGSSLIGSDFIDAERQTDLLKASARIKCYAQNNSLYIVSDEIQGKTNITAVNLDSFEEKYYTVEHKPAGDCSLITSQNSFLLNDHLLQVNVCEGRFTFTAYNLSTNKRASYSFNKDQEIDFKNSEVMQYGKSSLGPNEKQLNKTSQFIRKVDGSGLSVVGVLVDNTIEVTMGSSVVIQTGGGSMYMPGASVGPGGSVSLPGRWVSTGFYNSSTKTIFFRSLFDKNDLQHINSSLPLNDKMASVDEFLDKKNKYSVSPLFDGNNIITGYLDKDTKQFIIISF